MIEPLLFAHGSSSPNRLNRDEARGMAANFAKLPELVGLCEEVRNRLLRFALEIREELGHVGGKPSKVPAEKVEAAVINYIYGGVNVIAGTASDFTQIGNMVVAEGDVDCLAVALTTLGIPQSEIESLKDGIKADKGTFGARTKRWLAGVGSKLGNAGLRIGVEVATDLVKSWLRQYFGDIDNGFSV